MHKSKYILVALLITILHACSEPKVYIIETDMSLLQPDTINGETVAQSKKRSAIFMETNKSNTEGKYLPNIPVFDLEGKQRNLQDVVTKKTILVASDSYCGFGKASLLDDFPVALDSLKNELQDYDIICLIKRTPWDLEDGARFDSFFSELQKIYSPIYIIEESDAYKMNLFGNPARYYIDENQKVEHIASGTSSVENRIIELKAFTNGN